MIKLKDSNGKGIMQEQYKNTVQPGKPHGTWYHDPISNLLWVTISGREKLMAEVHEVVRISLTCAVTVDQFYAEEGINFLKNVASVLQVNPERIRIVDVVPGNYQSGRRLDDGQATSSQISFDVAALDQCDEYGSNCKNGGYCVAEGGVPSCRCDQVAFSGEFCEIPDEVVISEAEIVVTADPDEVEEDLDYVWNGTFIGNDTNVTTAMLTTMAPIVTTTTTDGDMGEYNGDIGSIALRAIEKISTGRFDIGIEVDPDSVSMQVPNISSVTDLVNGSLELDIPYVAPVHICGDGILTTREECDDGNDVEGDGCNSTCFMEPGYNCGENYLGELSVCQDTNECEELPVSPCHVLDTNATCDNLPGSYECTCSAGYRGVNCEEQIDECAEGLDTCDGNAACTDTPGSFDCNCNLGYSGDGFSCVDINECVENPPNCQNGGQCVDLVGRAICDCSQVGYFGEFCESQTDECSLQNVQCGDHGECVNDASADGYRCDCDLGWQLAADNTCSENVNECTETGQFKHQCPVVSTCVDTQGDYNCACDDGYQNQQNKLVCVDVNECEEDENACHADATCTNNVGGYTCECNSGFNDINGTCVDINECEEVPDACHEVAVCTNTAGSYECECSSGYRGDGVFACGDIKECREGKDNCDTYASCADDVEGSFTCTCNEGFTGDGTYCDDDNECDLGTHDCHSLAKCANTVGDYECDCIDGYEGDGKSCTEVDECETEPCANGGVCTDKVATFECACTQGWQGVTCEEDIDECSMDDPCHEFASCANYDGNYTCTCNGGYEGDGVSCFDINECKDAPCHEFASCTNTVGDYTCGCDLGYTGDGKSCTEVDECESSPCANGGICTDKVAAFECGCPEGWQGNECDEDIDECLVVVANTSLGKVGAELGPCDEHASCANNEGSYTCTCNSGYDGDGTSCTEASSNSADSEATTIGVASGVSVTIVLIIVVIVVVVLLRAKGKKANVVMPHDVVNTPHNTVVPEKFKPSFMPVVTEPEEKPKKELITVPAESVEIEADVVEEQPPKSLPEHVGAGQDPSIRLGQRVIAHGYQPGVVMYIGELKNMPSMEGMTYIGIKLDKPEGSGDGSVNGIQYFACDPFCSVFVTPHAVKPEETTA